MGIETDDVPSAADQRDGFITDSVSGLNRSFSVHTATSFLELSDQGAVSSRYSAFGNAACPCGSTWWNLVAGERGESGAIVLAQDLSVAGWSGTAVCAECGCALEVRHV
jgi:hypothetical protein